MFAILPCIHLENYTGKTLKTKYRHAVNTNAANDSNVIPRKIGSLFKFTPKRILHQNIFMEYVRDFHSFIHLPYCNLELSTTREINRKQHGRTCSSWSWINRTDSNPIAGARGNASKMIAACVTGIWCHLEHGGKRSCCEPFTAEPRAGHV